MTDPFDFEPRLEARLAAHAARASRPFDASAIATTAAVPQGSALRPWRGRDGRTSPVRVALALVLLAVAVTAGSILVGAALRGPTPLPDHQAVVPPSPDEFATAPPPSAAAGPSALPSTVPTSSPAVGLSTGNGSIILPLGRGTKAIAIAPDGSRTDLHLPIHSRSCPTYSPDGRSLAFLTRISSGPDAADQLVVSKPDGSDQRVLWSGRLDDQTFHQVIWSRDSRYVAATHASSDRSPSTGDRLIVGHPDGGAATVLDWGLGEFPGTLAWSPNGEELAAIRRIDDSTLGIEIRRLDGGTPRTLVTAPAIRSIAWSPDGKTIAYTAASPADPPGKTDLLFVEVDGSDPATIGANSPGSEGFLAWSPDGRQLAVLVFDSGSFNSGTFSTRLVDRQGGAIRRLGPFPVDGNLAFTWSPDGRSLLYTTGVDGNPGTGPRIIPIDGSPSRILEVASGDFYTQCPLTWQAIAP